MATRGRQSARNPESQPKSALRATALHLAISRAQPEELSGTTVQRAEVFYTFLVGDKKED